MGASQVGLEKGLEKTRKSIFSVLNFGFDFGSILDAFWLHFAPPKMDKKWSNSPKVHTCTHACMHACVHLCFVSPQEGPERPQEAPR